METNLSMSVDVTGVELCSKRALWSSQATVHVMVDPQAIIFDFNVAPCKTTLDP